VNDSQPSARLVIDRMGKCLANDGVETSCGCPEVLSGLSLAIRKNATNLASHCNLGNLDSIELHTRAGKTVHIEPSASEGLTIRF